MVRGVRARNYTSVYFHRRWMSDISVWLRNQKFPSLAEVLGAAEKNADRCLLFSVLFGLPAFLEIMKNHWKQWVVFHAQVNFTLEFPILKRFTINHVSLLQEASILGMVLVKAYKKFLLFIFQPSAIGTRQSSQSKKGALAKDRQWSLKNMYTRR